MNSYAELRQRQQKEFDAFPIGFAFSGEQYERQMREWGFEPTDTDKVVSLGVGGGFIRKTDMEAFHEMTDRHSKEREEALAADTTGEGYIYDMFRYELANHEYGYTYELDDTLYELGLTLEEIKKDKRLRKGLNKALKKYHGSNYKI